MPMANRWSHHAGGRQWLEGLTGRSAAVRRRSCSDLAVRGCPVVLDSCGGGPPPGTCLLVGVDRFSQEHRPRRGPPPMTKDYQTKTAVVATAAVGGGDARRGEHWRSAHRP